ncbi:MotA/TolQ/ExbB proton channel family protein, partial [bacterium]|nr:MotA/TolQ/ExbB proton channel family protein [bacterium]
MSVKKRLIYLGCLILFQGGMLSSLRGDESSYKIFISDIQSVAHKNWMGVPRLVDYTIYWEIYQQEGTQWNPADLTVCESFRVYCYQEDGLQDESHSGDLVGNFYVFNAKKAGVNYHLFVEGYKNGNRVALSDTANVVIGKELRAGKPLAVVQWHQWIPLNGRIPMAIVGRGEVFDNSTKAGQIAFHFIWNFLLAGLIIVLFCSRYMSLSNVFPLKRRFYIGRGFDHVYVQGISKDFQSIVNEWRELAENANDHVRQGLEGENHVQLEDMRMENVRFWREKGAKTIRHLLDRLYKFRNYPVTRIIQTGLENHELGGFRWLEVSREVDRAIENRASSELEHIRRRSHMDWLWNLGTLAPLLGLFGTATGISRSFSELSYLSTEITQTELIKRLSDGIFEALWTTIEGLFVGVSLMLLYYFYYN